MCRLFAITSDTPLSPMVAVDALDVMREGHDGSGVGLFMRDLEGPFAGIKGLPILSGIFTKAGVVRLDSYMKEKGFSIRADASIEPSQDPPKGVPKRDIYLIRAYEYPDEWKNKSKEETEKALTGVHIDLVEMGTKTQDMIIFSFWPDVVMIKEIGDPMTVGRCLRIDESELKARVIMAQGRQNTNYAINMYACHPFFLGGFATMTNGENTAFLPIKEFLMSRGEPGYRGFESDSQVFVYILHYMYKHLGLGIEAYKHIITPLQDDDLEKHPDRELLRHLKRTCRRLIIDGPNCVIGNLPDGTLFMVQDRKKLRPGVVGGRPGIYAFSSEICGLDAVIPDRDKSMDFQPMYTDTAIVRPDRKEVVICRQSDPLPPLR